MSEIKRYGMRAVTKQQFGESWDETTMIQQTSGSYVEYTDHLAALKQERIDAVQEFANDLLNNWRHKMDEDKDLQEVVVGIIRKGEGFFYAEGVKEALAQHIEQLKEQGQ